jgi:hypothetical protein
MLFVVLLNTSVEQGESYMTNNIITRWGIPNKFDQYPFGTPCKVVNATKFDLYVQFSHDANNPDWQLMGTFEDDKFDEYTEDIFNQLFGEDFTD